MPMEHADEYVGVSSRWWYLPGMYKPVAHCESCTKPPTRQSPGKFFTSVLRRKNKEHLSGVAAPPEGRVEKTGQLYRIPRIREPGEAWKAWSRECVTWPRYENGVFSLAHRSGPSMLDLTAEEANSLVIVVLRVDKQKECYGAPHTL